MILLKSLSFSLLIVSAILFSKSDITKNKIYNRWLLVGLVVGFVLSLTYLGFYEDPWQYYRHYLINILFGALFSIIMYSFHIWAGGDAKLFIVLSVLVPVDCYYLVNINSIIVIFILIYSAAFLYLFGESIVLRIKGAEPIRTSFSIYSLLYSVSYIVFVSSCISIFNLFIVFCFKTFYIENYVLVMFLNILFILFIQKIYDVLPKFLKYLISLLGVILWIFSGVRGEFYFSLNSLFVVLIVLAMRMISGEYNYKQIKTSEVKEGMVLSYATVARFANSRVKGLPLTTTEDIKSRITEEEAESIRRLEFSKLGLRTVTIVRKIPFACFISIGFILFILLGRIV